MRGHGTAHGAVSIVNAIAGGRGATLSVALKTEASVELQETTGGWRTTINGRTVDSKLPLEVVAHVLNSRGKDAKKYKGRIDTVTEIPVGVGLKSSSSSSVAIALATLAALGEGEYDAGAVLNFSADASISAGVSVTGALDDAAACLNGGINHADNLRRRVLKSETIDAPLRVVIGVPRLRSRRGSVRLQFLRRFSKLAEMAFTMSVEGDPWGAMVLNGMIYSSLLRYDSSSAMRALSLGALGSGLSGTGPAVSAVFSNETARASELLRKEWERDGSRVIVTESNNERGKMVRLE